MKAISFENESFESKYFENLGVIKFLAVNCKFSNCHFKKFTAKEVCFGAGIGPTEYIGCTFTEASFSSNAAGRAIFKSCNFDKVRFVKLFCAEIIFIDCTFNGVFEKGSMVGELLINKGYTDYSSTKTIGNDFSGLNIKDVYFHQFDFNQQKFCNGDNRKIIRDLAHFIKVARKKISSIDNFHLCDGAHRVINILELKNEDGNNQAFLNPSNFPKVLQSSAEFLLSLNN